jgi:ABC-type phosphate/phosphonate transport system substrate-binding protein
MTAPTAQPNSVAGLAPIASLAMYDQPPIQHANDTLWAAIAERLQLQGVEAPLRLTRDVDLDEVWTHPGLLLGQACAYPLMTTLKDVVQVVATPRYAAAGCEGAFHRSAIVVNARHGPSRLEALRGARCVVNDLLSNTGTNVLRAQIAPLAREGRFFGEVQVTGAHAASLAAVAAGKADVAAIDGVTFALLGKLEPDLTAAVRVIGWTRVCPGLPFVTAAATSVRGLGALRRALESVAADPSLETTRQALLLEGFTILPPGAYDEILDFERFAAWHGYRELA